MARLLVVFGTRPEAVKLCPLIEQLRLTPGFEVTVCVTAQHRGMLDQVLDTFGVQPDIDLNLMQPGQTLADLTARLIQALDPVLAQHRPQLTIVQGDTTTTFAAALASFYRHAPVAHVEAGLRTGDRDRPFPEELNRILTARLATLHFAPTAGARANLLREGVSAAAIHVTGNTGIDAVLRVAARRRERDLPLPTVPAGRKRIVVTSHRRENFGDGFERVMRALQRLAARTDVEIIYPVHRNPNVLGVAHSMLSNRPNVHLVEPLNYVPFVDLMRGSYLIVTDSGGIQEEAPSLGKPVLVLRESTERPEAVEAGTVKLVGTDEERIVDEVVRLLDDPAEYHRMTRIHNPYGDGHASPRIARAIAAWLANGGSAGNQ